MNAEALVTAAKGWVSVPKQTVCTTFFPTFKAKTFGPNKPGNVTFRTDACKGQRNEVNFVEHLQVIVDIDYPIRGNLAIYLTSPAGTKVQLLAPRKRDRSNAGFRRWPFMSVHSWGENPNGWWQLLVYDEGDPSAAELSTSGLGTINNLTLVLYGTQVAPGHYKTGRQYNMHYNQIKDRSIDSELEKRHGQHAQGETIQNTQTSNEIDPDEYIRNGRLIARKS